MPNLLLTAALKARLRALAASEAVIVDDPGFSDELFSCVRTEIDDVKTVEDREEDEDKGTRAEGPVPEHIPHALLVRTARWVRTHTDQLAFAGLGTFRLGQRERKHNNLTEHQNLPLQTGATTLSRLYSLAQTASIYLRYPSANVFVSPKFVSAVALLWLTKRKTVLFQSPELERILDDVRIRLELARTSDNELSKETTVAQEWASTRRELGAIVNVLVSMVGVGVAVGWAAGETVPLGTVRKTFFLIYNHASR
jgi:hypothetical protein